MKQLAALHQVHHLVIKMKHLSLSVLIITAPAYVSAKTMT